MINIGINYITDCNSPVNPYDEIYRFLVKNEYINTIKFPGKYCNDESLKAASSLAEKLNSKLDIHGLPGMVAAIYSNQFLERVNWKNIESVLGHTKVERFSTHLGLENKDKLSHYTNAKLEEIWTTNVNTLKNEAKKIWKKEITIGVENIPGGFEYDLQTMTPEFISTSWKKADFGVFDITHAKIAANEFNMSYKEYVTAIENKQKVKILHVSGNVDETNQFEGKPDKHVLIHESEIEDIIEALHIFNHLDLVVSEYGFCTKYDYPKEIIIEAITLYNIVKTRDSNISKRVLKFLEENLEENLSNLQQVIKELK